MVGIAWRQWVRGALLAAALGTTALAGDAVREAHRTGPFMLGADVSWVQEDEANGTVYYDRGVQKDVFAILKGHGFNAIRLRVFVNPKSPKGYAATSKEAFCDKEHTLAMARRAHAAGMRLLVDFHYSDNWADPGKQATPAAWEGLDLEGLKKAVYAHTRDVLEGLKKQGTPLALVQIGNEVNNGMLWPTGDTKEHFDNFAELLKAGVAASREVYPTAPVVIHSSTGSNNKATRKWLDGLIARGVQFDVIGLSCNDQGSPDNWKKNFDDLATHYPQFGLIASEYGYHKRELNDIVYNTPGQRGLGTFIWEPTRHHEALFDHDGHNAGQGTQKSATRRATTAPVTTGHRPRTGRHDTNELINLYPQMAKEYGIGG